MHSCTHFWCTLALFNHTKIGATGIKSPILCDVTPKMTVLKCIKTVHTLCNYQSICVICKSFFQVSARGIVIICHFDQDDSIVDYFVQLNGDTASVLVREEKSKCYYHAVNTISFQFPSVGYLYCTWGYALGADRCFYVGMHAQSQKAPNSEDLAFQAHH